MTTTKEEKLREEFYEKFSVWNNKWQFASKTGVEETVTTQDVADYFLSKRKEELESLIGELEGMKKPEEIGYYGPHDQLHIQYNIGFNAALEEAITKIKALI